MSCGNGCETCPYHYKDNGDKFPCCHFESVAPWWDRAPCEDDEYEAWLNEEQ